MVPSASCTFWLKATPLIVRPLRLTLTRWLGSNIFVARILPRFEWTQALSPSSGSSTASALLATHVVSHGETLGPSANPANGGMKSGCPKSPTSLRRTNPGFEPARKFFPVWPRLGPSAHRAPQRGIFTVPRVVLTRGR
jgi:hypothetical protein